MTQVHYSPLGLILAMIIMAGTALFGCVAVPPEQQPLLVPVTTVRPDGPPIHTGELPEVFQDLPSLAAAADLIIRGRATGQHQFQITAPVVNRLNVALPEVRLRLMDLLPGGPPLYGDPPLVAGQEYLLFLRTLDGAHSRRFLSGDRTFRPVGGSQGQWRVQGGTVSQTADVPLKSRSGESVEGFAAGVVASDLRRQAAALLKQYGWTPTDASWVRLQQVGRLPAPILEASRAIGLDPAPFADRHVLWMSYPVESGPSGGRLEATVLMIDGNVVGAWVNVGGHRAFPLDQQEQARTAAADAASGPTTAGPRGRHRMASPSGWALTTPQFVAAIDVVGQGTGRV